MSPPSVAKSLRDLWAYRWQVSGITLLLATVTCGVAGGSRLRAMLRHTAESWSRDLALCDAEIITTPVRPDALVEVRAVKGVADVEGRLVTVGSVHWSSGRPLPSLIHVLPEAGAPRLNRLEVLHGRLPDAGEVAVVIDRSLSSLHGLQLGDEITVRANDRAKTLPVVGISLSPEHLMYPVHPYQTLPVRGSLGVLAVSAAAAADVEDSDRVNSVLLRVGEGHEVRATVETAVAILGADVVEVRWPDEQPGRVFARMISTTFDLYVPALTAVLMVIVGMLLIFTLATIVSRQSKQIATLLSLGYGRGRLASTFIGIGLLPVLFGIFVGGLLHGPFASVIYAAYARGAGNPPLRDPGVGAALWWCAAACLALCTLAWGVPLLRVTSRPPAELLRAGPAGPGRASAAAWFAVLGRALRLPVSVRLGLTGAVGRRWGSAAAALGLGSVFGLVLAFLLVHVAHRQEIEASVRDAALDATVYLAEPGGEDVVVEIARAAQGTAEPIISRPLLLDAGGEPTWIRVVAAACGGWAERFRIGEGRRFSGDAAYELVVDRRTAVIHRIAPGDFVTVFPQPGTPDGLMLEVVGVVEGISPGWAALPLETGRRLFGLPGQATALQVASERSPRALGRALWDRPGVESVTLLANAREEVDAVFEGTEVTLALETLLAAGMAALFLGILIVFDTTARGPELAILDGLGWQRRALVSMFVTEVVIRTLLALIVAVVLGRLLAAWLADRLQAANHYQLHLVDAPWIYVLVVASAVLLLPVTTAVAIRSAGRTLREQAAHMMLGDTLGAS